MILVVKEHLDCEVSTVTWLQCRMDQSFYISEPTKKYFMSKLFKNNQTSYEFNSAYPTPILILDNKIYAMMATLKDNK